MTNDLEAVVSLHLFPVFFEVSRHLGLFSHVINQWSIPLPLVQCAFTSKEKILEKRT